MKAQICQYCGKSLNGQAKFHRGGNIFCNEQEATLHDYADIAVTPPYPKENPFPKPEALKPIHPINQPFDKELP